MMCLFLMCMIYKLISNFGMIGGTISGGSDEVRQTVGLAD